MKAYDARISCVSKANGVSFQGLGPAPPASAGQGGGAEALAGDAVAETDDRLADLASDGASLGSGGDRQALGLALFPVAHLALLHHAQPLLDVLHFSVLSEAKGMTGHWHRSGDGH